jgi:hypothetical protein
MLAMCRQLGFEIAADPNDEVICIVKLTHFSRGLDLEPASENCG